VRLEELTSESHTRQQALAADMVRFKNASDVCTEMGMDQYLLIPFLG
jgi:hypothetical protein